MNIELANTLARIADAVIADRKAATPAAVTRDQSEDYLDYREVRVYRDAPGGGLNVTLAHVEGQVAELKRRGIVNVEAEVIDHIPAGSRHRDGWEQRGRGAIVHSF